MSVSGLCELCTQNEVVDGCDRCGRLVCERHYDEKTGLCTDCLREVGGDPSDEGESQPDGVDTYRV
jgi:ribosomal protein S14